MKENPKLELMKVFNALKECRLDGIREVATHKDIEVLVELIAPYGTAYRIYALR